jgi:hypothetical protein
MRVADLHVCGRGGRGQFALAVRPLGNGAGAHEGLRAHPAPIPR